MSNRTMSNRTMFNRAMFNRAMFNRARFNCFNPAHWLPALGFTLGSFLVSGCGGGNSGSSETSPNLNLPVTIPVVFHVIVDPNKPESNVSNEVIEAQMQVLNQVFSQKNEDIAFLGGLKSLTEDTQIRFKLAKHDPNGEPFSGINRLGDVPPGSAEAPEWPHQQYLNVWVDNLESHNGKLGVLGSAKLHCYNSSDTASRYSDGIEIHYEALLINDKYSARTLPHEIGHWLGLSHAFGSADNCNSSVDMSIAEAGGLETGTWDNTQRFCSNNNMMQEGVGDLTLRLFTRGQSSIMKKAFAPGNCRAKLYQNLTENQ